MMMMISSNSKKNARYIFQGTAIRSTDNKLNGPLDSSSQIDMFPLLDIFLQPMNALLPHVASHFNKELGKHLDEYQYSYLTHKRAKQCYDHVCFFFLGMIKIHDSPYNISSMMYQGF